MPDSTQSAEECPTEGSVWAHYRVTADDFLDIASLHRRQSLTPILRFGSVFFRGFGVFAMLACLIVPVEHFFAQKQPRNATIAASLTSLAILLYFACEKPIRRCLIRRRFCKAYKGGGSEGDHEYCFSQVTISWKTSLVEATGKWGLISKIVESPEGFLLYVDELNCHWIPMRAFVDEVGPEQLAHLAREKVPNYVVFGPVRKPATKPAKLIIDEI